MPVAEICGRKRPAKAGRCEACADMRIVDDVFFIVVIDELMIFHLEIDTRGQDYEKQGDQ